MASKLPKKLSDGIELAVKDLEKVERSKNYVVNMGAYHEPSEYEYDPETMDYQPDTSAPCAVCFAGAVMAKTLGVTHNEDTGPYVFRGATEQKLYALDSIRTGQVRAAVSRWYNGNPPKNPFTEEEDETPTLFKTHDVVVVAYEDDPGLFKKTMRQFAKQLRAAGL